MIQKFRSRSTSPSSVQRHSLSSNAPRRLFRQESGMLFRLLLLLALSVMAALVLTAGAARTSASQQPPGRISPLGSLTTPAFTRQLTATRSTFELPSARYQIAVDDVSPVYEMGPLAPGALSGLADNQVGVGRPVDPDLDSQSVTVRNPDGTRLRVFSVRSEGAHGLRLHFKDIDLPDGDQLFVYGSGPNSHVAGPYAGKGPFGNGDFWADVVEGDTAIVEHLIASKRNRSHVTVAELSHLLTGLDDSPFAPQILSCEVDASCGSFGEKDGVGRIFFTDPGAGSFVCTGTLLNNRTLDHTPFFLTAAHCVNNEAAARTVVTYWFYQTTMCNGSTLRQSSVSTSGATMLVTSQSSDETLLRIQGPLPGGVLFVGWDPNPRGDGTDVFGLHHPGGGIPPSLSSFLRSAGGVINGRADCPAVGLLGGYLVPFSSGNTEPGSSGSGLFASDGSGVIGVLSCGPSPASCATGQRIGLYSKFSDFYPLISTFLEGGGGSGTCVNGISPGSTQFTAAGGGSSFNVSAGDTCNWTAMPSDSWITISSGAQGTGNGTVSLQVGANTSPNARTGSVTVQSQAYSIFQSGQTCNFTLTPDSRTFLAAGGSGTVDIQSPSNCSWTAITTAAWVTVTSGTQGTGPATISYTVAANSSGDQRVAQIIAGGQVHTVTQNGILCTFAISSSSISIPFTGAAGTITVTAPNGCAWSSSSDAGWLVVTSGSNGSGNGSFSYSAAANLGSSGRTGHIAIADKSFTVTQGAGPVINSAVINGAKLIVTGINFVDGAALLMDGVKQKKTHNDEGSPSTMLIAKKTGKKIAPGQTVMLQVRNPDGTLSAAFSFTRPISDAIVNPGGPIRRIKRRVGRGIPAQVN